MQTEGLHGYFGDAGWHLVSTEGSTTVCTHTSCPVPSSATASSGLGLQPHQRYLLPHSAERLHPRHEKEGSGRQVPRGTSNNRHAVPKIPKH